MIPSPSIQKRDVVVVGAGAFGLYAAGLASRQGKSVAVVDISARPFARASLVNQARLHNGYHYPRSLSTALSAKRYFDRFAAEFPSAINGEFTKIYATSARGSFTNAGAFADFCVRAGIHAKYVDPSAYFKPNTVDGAFETIEWSFDAEALHSALVNQMDQKLVDWYLDDSVVAATPADDSVHVLLRSETEIEAGFVINATYAGTNAVNHTFGLESLPLKYELCEVVLGKASTPLETLGITVMDGPFFSVMPFGLSGVHSATAVGVTPRIESRSNLPVFGCQDRNASCTPAQLADCTRCPERPTTGWAFMKQLMEVYLNENLTMDYVHSLFTVKTVLATAEVDDSRPTVLQTGGEAERVLTVFSGKLSTLFDLEALV